MELARYMNLPPRRERMLLLAEDAKEPWLMPAMELVRALDTKLSFSLSLRTLTSSMSLPLSECASMNKFCASDLDQMESLSALL